MAMLAQIAALLAAEGADDNPLLRVNPGLWLWTLVVFIGLFLVLRKWGFGTMISKLETRDRAIRGAIDEARRERQEAERLLAEQKEMLNQARRQTSEMLASAKEQAEHERQRLLGDARAEYEKVVARGREQLEHETRAALDQVRQTTAALALEVAGKLVQQTLDQPGQKRLAEQFVKELEKM